MDLSTKQPKGGYAYAGIAETDKIRVIPLGFELDKFLDIPPRSMGEALNIGIVGRLVPVKNHRLFLEAARDCFISPAAGLTMRVRAKFILVGDGNYDRSLKNTLRS